MEPDLTAIGHRCPTCGAGHGELTTLRARVEALEKMTEADTSQVGPHCPICGGGTTELARLRAASEKLDKLERSLLEFREGWYLVASGTLQQERLIIALLNDTAYLGIGLTPAKGGAPATNTRADEGESTFMEGK